MRKFSVDGYDYTMKEADLPKNLPEPLYSFWKEESTIKNGVMIGPVIKEIVPGTQRGEKNE